jgi:hypothetical protein
MPAGGPSGGIGGFMGFIGLLRTVVELAATGFGVYIFWRAVLAFEKYVEKYQGK